MYLIESWEPIHTAAVVKLKSEKKLLLPNYYLQQTTGPVPRTAVDCAGPQITYLLLYVHYEQHIPGHRFRIVRILAGAQHRPTTQWTSCTESYTAVNLTLSQVFLLTTELRSKTGQERQALALGDAKKFGVTKRAQRRALHRILCNILRSRLSKLGATI